MTNKFKEIKQSIQQVLDLAASKKYTEANHKLASTGDLLDEMFDHSTQDSELIEISRYQLLLNQLQQKINTP